MKLKDDFSMHEDSANKMDNMHEFKARPFNRKIFEKSSGKLPSVDKRAPTQFTEFSLSNSNIKLGKRTLEEYLNKENTGQFKAMPLDKKIFDQASLMTPKKEKPQVTETVPFSFMTDERLKSQKSLDRDESESTKAVHTFKALPMPKYKHFEVKHNHEHER